MPRNVSEVDSATQAELLKESAAVEVLPENLQSCSKSSQVDFGVKGVAG